MPPPTRHIATTPCETVRPALGRSSRRTLAQAHRTGHRGFSPNATASHAIAARQHHVAPSGRRHRSGKGAASERSRRGRAWRTAELGGGAVRFQATSGRGSRKAARRWGRLVRQSFRKPKAGRLVLLEALGPEIRRARRSQVHAKMGAQGWDLKEKRCHRRECVRGRRARGSRGASPADQLESLETGSLTQRLADNPASCPNPKRERRLRTNYQCAPLFGLEAAPLGPGRLPLQTTQSRGQSQKSERWLGRSLEGTGFSKLGATRGPVLPKGVPWRCRLRPTVGCAPPRFGPRHEVFCAALRVSRTERHETTSADVVSRRRETATPSSLI